LRKGSSFQKKSKTTPSRS
jgi:hypothetical protein